MAWERIFNRLLITVQLVTVRDHSLENCAAADEQTIESSDGIDQRSIGPDSVMFIAVRASCSMLNSTGAVPMLIGPVTSPPLAVNAGACVVHKLSKMRIALVRGSCWQA
ncbi:MAG TPA: hypothetical protein VGD45_11670 [Steroidobacter sp.]|uniref:hypothetical protein n=1 Tax=Steroidobacter sp. TaxID=1978227 RepID=UPI002ED80AC7